MPWFPSFSGLIQMKGTTAQDGHHKGIHSQDFLQIPVILIDIFEIRGQKFFQNIRAHSLIHQRFFFYFYIKMQIWAFFLIIFFHCDPVRYRLPGQLDHTFDAIL